MSIFRSAFILVLCLSAVNAQDGLTLSPRQDSFLEGPRVCAGSENTGVCVGSTDDGSVFQSTTVTEAVMMARCLADERCQVLSWSTVTSGGSAFRPISAGTEITTDGYHFRKQGMSSRRDLAIEGARVCGSDMISGVCVGATSGGSIVQDGTTVTEIIMRSRCLADPRCVAVSFSASSNAFTPLSAVTSTTGAGYHLLKTVFDRNPSFAFGIFLCGTFDGGDVGACVGSPGTAYIPESE
eukprot:991205_1